MNKWTNRIFAILLLPFCVGATIALVRVLRATENSDTIWVATLSGAICWMVVYLLLPKPMWIYVFGHELTHVIWAWIFGGKVKRFQATAKGGQVVVTRSNFLVALAPYFFPIYAFGIASLFAIGNLIWGWSRYLVYLHLLIGAAYAFHISLTWHILKNHQSDLAQEGYLFSIVVIWLGNISILIIGIPWLTGEINVATAFTWCWVETMRIVQGMSSIL